MSTEASNEGRPRGAEPWRCPPESLRVAVVGPCTAEESEFWGGQGVLTFPGRDWTREEVGRAVAQLPAGRGMPVLARIEALYGSGLEEVASGLHALGLGAVAAGGNELIGPVYSDPAEGLRQTAAGQFARMQAAANLHLRRAGRPEIGWDPHSPVLIFTDGAASDNGGPAAAAGFAAVFVGGPFGATLATSAAISGPVAPRAYKLVDPADLTRGVTTTEAPVAPSNNRGELLGMIHGLLGALVAGARRVEVVCDSRITVQTLLEWLPRRLQNKTAEQLCNYDLVSIAWALLSALRAASVEIELTHVRSHQQRPPPSAGARASTVWAGNGLADRHAGGAVGRANRRATVLRGPPVLARIADPTMEEPPVARAAPARRPTEQPRPSTETKKRQGANRVRQRAAPDASTGAAERAATPRVKTSRVPASAVSDR